MVRVWRIGNGFVFVWISAYILSSSLVSLSCVWTLFFNSLSLSSHSFRGSGFPS